MIKVYAFDFDGVIGNSAHGWAIFSRDAWEKVSKIKPPSVSDIEKHRPYIKDAKESYGLLLLLSKKSKVSRKNVKECSEKEPEKAKEFADAFFKEKNNFIERNKEKFNILYGPYEFMPSFLKKFARENKVYIVTSNKKEQVLPIIQNEKIPIDESHVLGSSVSFDKKINIKMIIKRENIKVSEILLVEDSIEHIRDVMSIGVKGALATWGYVLPEDIEEAKNLGVTILTKNNLLSLSSSVEYFDVVDKNDRVVSRASRDECHKKGLLHRAVHILIINSKGEMLMQKRSMKKDLYPGWWIDAASGHVDSGEDSDVAAKRELMEEIGVKAALEYILTVRKTWSGSGKIDNEIIRVYLGHSDGPFKINDDEVELVRFYEPKKVLEMMKDEKLTPATVKILEEIKKHPKLLRTLGLS